MVRGVAKWVVDHVMSKHRYAPRKGPKLRKELTYERKALTGHYYQLLSGRAAIGDYLWNKIHKLWCG